MGSAESLYVFKSTTRKSLNFFLFTVPSSTLTRLNNGFAKIGDKASGAKQGLINLESKWNNIPFGDRAVVTQTLQSAASNIEKFANAGDDPLGAVRGAIDMVAQFAALAGPKGQIVSIALSFVSGFLSLFGSGGKQQKSVGQIVREEIEEALAEHYEKSLSNEAQGMYFLRLDSIVSYLLFVRIKLDALIYIMLCMRSQPRYELLSR